MIQILLIHLPQITVLSRVGVKSSRSKETSLTKEEAPSIAPLIFSATYLLAQVLTRKTIMLSGAAIKNENKIGSWGPHGN